MLFRLSDVSRTQSVWESGSRKKNPARVGMESEEIPHGFPRVRVNAG